MRTLFGVAFLFAAWGLSVAPAAQAQEVATASTRVRMVRAFCTTGPCAPSLNFTSGAALLRRIKQPKPLSKRKIGRLHLNGVTAPLLPGALEARMTARFVWDTVDPDGDCPDLGSDSTQVLATSSMFCKPSGLAANCGGDLLAPVGLFDPRCTDVRLTLLDLNVEVYEFGNVGVETSRVAVPGLTIVGRSPDCSSGGSGCP